MPSEIKVHNLDPGMEVKLTIHARHKFSKERVKLVANATYEITCNENQHWWDLVIRTTPKGYPKGPANLIGVRVKDAPIFSLCAALLDADPGKAETDDNVFRVKIEAQPHRLSPTEEQVLCFFANDAKGWIGWYWNNFGSVEVVVKWVG